MVGLELRGLDFKEARLMSFPAGPKDSQTSTTFPQFFNCYDIIMNYFLPPASTKLLRYFQYALAANVWGTQL